ncbi:surface antigen-like protein [Arcticibacter tournemirensis]|uniref:BamA/TamA family outer membrane protein n=1 Tax=Arcticibacter tournemirensis TaxID=699437 RepID=A0A5M9H6V4_9SPHI|nr:BamA/TamA family outer membrane protein [Arcticibacter tournemirensis]KAA8482596.1 BamA/TamA family outer membrane protein [Arcticibacter tournemirensis]TQM52570.1 surface antigen-like protein [Arcticibacter tournemirensis]
MLIYNKLTISFIILLYGSAALAVGNKPQSRDTITIAIAPEYNEVSSSHRFWLGENYRKLWATPVRMRILDLKSERGGLSVVKLGGGMQTKSLRLKDGQGQEWVLRTIQKYPERGLPENLRPTVARDILQDQVSTAHPYGALAVPLLAEALQLPHSNPEIVYVADDPGLGEYREEFANAVYLFEEREPVGLEDTDNTLKVQDELEEDNDARVIQKLVLRARLLDFMVGDWDRHEDNWRWGREKSKGEKIYTPVPRDRDKVFYKTSGVFPWILSHQWLKSNLQPYDKGIRDIAGWNYNARYFDRYFLTQLAENDWKEEIANVQKTITDSLAEKAIRQMPDTIFALSGLDVLDKLKGRRDNLNKIALDYYHFLAGNVDIPLSQKREFIDVKYRRDGNIEVSVYNKKKDGSKGRLLYQRVFIPKETNEIRIYGLAGEDVYTVSGKGKPAIKVRLAGGKDRDVFSVNSSFTNRKHLYIYDQPDSNIFPDRSLAKLRLSNDSTVNSFDRKAFKYDRFGPMALINYNIDQGIQLRAGILYEKQGFRKTPFAVKHEFWANYSTGRNSYIFNYLGEFKKAIGKNDLSIDLNSWGPNNQTNFFGRGNESIFLRHDEGGIGFYRNRFDYLTASVRLHRNIVKNLRVNAGIGTEFYTSAEEDNKAHFFESYAISNPEANVFSDKLYAGLVAGARYDTRDDESMPTRGVYWNMHITAKRQMNGENNSYGSLKSDLSLYVSPPGSDLVIANRLGGGTTFGNPAFFQEMQLGGVNNLRGFHTNRFTGKTMLYHNLDLRLRLFHFTSYLFPGSVGVLGFHDTGRVWLPSQSSNKWHHGYGGGLYVVPAELILIQGAVGFSKEGSLPYISVGFNF